MIKFCGDHAEVPRNKKLIIVILRQEQNICIHERVQIANTRQMIHPVRWTELALVLFQFSHSCKIGKSSSLGVHIPMNWLGHHELLAPFEARLLHLANLQSLHTLRGTPRPRTWREQSTSLVPYFMGRGWLNLCSKLKWQDDIRERLRLAKMKAWASDMILRHTWRNLDRDGWDEI